MTPVVDWKGALCEGADLPRFVLLAGLIRESANGNSILDIGCGRGDLQRFLPGFSYTGIDACSSSISTAEDRDSPLSTFLCVEAERWEPIGKFDVIVFNESLYYLRNFAGALSKYSGALTPGGLIAVSIFRRGGWRNPNRTALNTARDFMSAGSIHEVALTVNSAAWDILISRA